MLSKAERIIVAVLMWTALVLVIAFSTSLTLEGVMRELANTATGSFPISLQRAAHRTWVYCWPAVYILFVASLGWVVLRIIDRFRVHL